ncbi:MAG: hypothetical protein IPG43_20145 [Proteobacteria bacterium]|nr:hypothetical protein [Pseudomonadota bacterium]
MGAHRFASFAVATLLAFSHGATAGTLELVLASHPGAVTHAPGLDGLVGTADDLVSAAPLAPVGAAPNLAGALSFTAFDFGVLPSSPALPVGFDAVTFLAGTVAVDTDVAVNGGGPLVTGFSVSGSEPLPGHGPYAATITTVHGGSYDPITRAMTLDIDFTASLLGGTANAISFQLSGIAALIDAADFGAPTGIPYLDSVLLPSLAVPLGANSLFFASISGIVPASSGGTGGAFPLMPITAVLVGVEIAPVPLPASLPLLAGAMPVVGLFMRRGLASGRRWLAQSSASSN